MTEERRELSHELSEDGVERGRVDVPDLERVLEDGDVAIEGLGHQDRAHVGRRDLHRVAPGRVLRELGALGDELLEAVPQHRAEEAGGPEGHGRGDVAGVEDAPPPSGDGRSSAILTRS